MPTDPPRKGEGEVVREEAPTTADEPLYFETTISVLGYREDDEWVALALEMDLRGYGATWDEALQDLRDLVLMQIGFAHFKGQLDMIWKSAEKKYWDRFRRVQRSRLMEAITQADPRLREELHAGGLSIPLAHVIAAQSGRFLPANG